MRILCLYNNPCALPLFSWLQQEGHETILHTEQLTKDWCLAQKFDLTVSYTYLYVLSSDILSALGNNAVNLHNSFLPWNRGKDPSLWSIMENTPRGVTLHYMESGLDKGAIIAQKLVPLVEGDTLKTSYYTLDKAAQEQFRQAFQWYNYWGQMKKAPLGEGSYHSAKDGAFFREIIDTYDMPVKKFRELVQTRVIKKDDSISS